MTTQILNSLSSSLDLLSHNDRSAGTMDEIFRQFSAFITSSLGTLKTASSKRSFNGNFGRFLCFLLLHHSNHYDRVSTNPTSRSDEFPRIHDERIGVEDARTIFFTSCLTHLVLLSAPSRRLLAQVLRRCNLYPTSGPGLTSALISLLEAHPQKTSFDSLTDFLELWLLGEEECPAVSESERVVIEAIAAVLVRGNSMSGSISRSFFALLRSLLRSTEKARISQSSIAHTHTGPWDGTADYDGDSPLWMIFWSELWSLYEAAPTGAAGTEAQMMGVELLLKGGSLARQQFLCQQHDDSPQKQVAMAESTRLTVCLQLASGPGGGGVNMFALKSTVHHMLDSWKQNYSSRDDSVFPMLKVLMSGILTVFIIIRSLLRLPHTEEDSNIEEEIEEICSACASFHQPHVESKYSYKHRYSSSGVKKSISRKVQTECLSILAVVVEANPFQRCFPLCCSSPVTALSRVMHEIDILSTASEGSRTNSAVSMTEWSSEDVELKKLEISFLEPLHSLLTVLTSNLLSEENIGGVSASTLAKLETILISMACGGACTETLLRIQVEMQSKNCGFISAPSAGGVGDNPKGVATSETIHSPPGCALLRRVLELRACVVEVALGVAQTAILSWGALSSPGIGVEDVFCCPELCCLASISEGLCCGQQNQSLYAALLERLHSIKAQQPAAVESSPPLLDLLSLLLASSCFAMASADGFLREKLWIVLVQFLLDTPALHVFRMKCEDNKMHASLGGSGGKVQGHDQDGDSTLEFVFWLNLLACQLHGCDGEVPSHALPLLRDLVCMLYPSPFLLLPHLLPVAVRLACCLPPATFSSSSLSSLRLLCETLGYFQDIVFTSSVAKRGGSGGLVQYIDLLTLVIKENTASIQRICRQEVLSRLPVRRWTDVANSDAYNSSQFHEASSQGEKLVNSSYVMQQQREEISDLVQLRLLQSVATSTSTATNQEKGRHLPQSPSFIGCFVPFIGQILLDSLRQYQQPGGSLLPPPPPATVTCAALRFWGQYLLCGGTATPPCLLHDALLRLPHHANNDDIGVGVASSGSTECRRDVSLISTARRVFQVKIQALSVYLQTFPAISTRCCGPGSESDGDDGGVLVAVIIELIDFVRDLEAGMEKQWSTEEEGEAVGVSDPPCNSVVYEEGGDGSDGNSSGKEELERRRRGRKRKKKCDQISGKAMNKTSTQQTARLKKKGTLVCCREDTSSDEEFKDIEGHVSSPCAGPEVVRVSTSFDVRKRKSHNEAGESLAAMRMVHAEAVRALEALLAGLQALVLQQSIKQLAAGALALALPLCFFPSSFFPYSAAATAEEACAPVEVLSVLMLKRVFCSFPWAVGRIIFTVSSIHAEQQHTLGEAGRRSESSKHGSSVSLDKRVCTRLRTMTLEQKGRLLRLVLFASSLSSHQKQNQSLQKAVVEEILRTPHPILLASLLVPPSCASENPSSPLYMRITDAGALRVLRESENRGYWQALDNDVQDMLREAQRSACVCGEKTAE